MCEGEESEVQKTSALADFDAGEVLDVISSGILVLDQELCAVYANPTAETLLMIRLEQLRGRPLPNLLREGGSLAHALRQALDGQETVCDCDVALTEQEPRVDRCERLRVSLLRNQVARNYLLLQLEGYIGVER